MALSTGYKILLGLAALGGGAALIFWPKKASSSAPSTPSTQASPAASNCFALFNALPTSGTDAWPNMRETAIRLYSLGTKLDATIASPLGSPMDQFAGFLAWSGFNDQAECIRLRAIELREKS